MSSGAWEPGPSSFSSSRQEEASLRERRFCDLLCSEYSSSLETENPLPAVVLILPPSTRSLTAEPRSPLPACCYTSTCYVARGRLPIISPSLRISMVRRDNMAGACSLRGAQPRPALENFEERSSSSKRDSIPLDVQREFPAT